MSEDIWALSIADTAKLIEKGEISPVAVVESCLHRVEAVGSSLDAFITLTPEIALEQARRAEEEIAAGNYRGPLHGIPFGLKDIYNTANILTTAHSRILIDNVPDEDATTTSSLRLCWDDKELFSVQALATGAARPPLPPHWAPSRAEGDASEVSKTPKPRTIRTPEYPKG